MTASGYRMYSKSSRDSQYELIERYAPLVKRIAYHLLARLPASVQVDDLIQAGLIGLLDAAKNFDDTQGAQFETYAIQRIRGSIRAYRTSAARLPSTIRVDVNSVTPITAGTS